MSFTAFKVISPSTVSGQESACDVLEPAILVAKASGTCVVLKEKQRKK